MCLFSGVRRAVRIVGGGGAEYHAGCRERVWKESWSLGVVIVLVPSPVLVGLVVGRAALVVVGFRADKGK